ncbi:hypothetical protein PYW07_006390 [Mythimna separata]|uniref:Uncharacterized protein n=1 Tax=Mythimna separata TaxID=271217 RepID=A0AAD7YVY6_MYTSE|nr:hypothetical protein PYW07_006390 [Mythimna separata]
MVILAERSPDFMEILGDEFLWTSKFEIIMQRDKASCLGDWIVFVESLIWSSNFNAPYGYYNTRQHNNDHNHDSIIRPCSIKQQDEDCIRRVFTSHFNCLPMHGPVPDPYIADTLDMEIPHTNLTFTINDAKIKGLSSGKIKEFYFNKETDRFVLEVVFDSVVVFSPRSVVTHYRKGKEPVESTDFSVIEFKTLSLTLVISNSRKEVWKAHVYAYLTDADTPYKFGPGLIESKDHQQQGPIERPCSLHDVNCIKDYFGQNSQCSPVQGLGPDYKWIKRIPMSVPHVNITFTLNDVEVKGYNNFYIKEFYINKHTGRLVLEVVFRKLWVYSPITVIEFFRRGKEPLVVADYAVIEYKDLSMTLIASQDKGIDLSEAHVYTYITDARPKQALGPNFLESKDHQTNRDYHDSIIKPCSLDDLNCIRRVFAHNSKCKPVKGPAPDPYMLKQLDLPIPQANLTFSLINAQVKGLNEWKIHNFFINKATDRLLLEVVFDRIVVASPGAKTTCHHGLSFTLTIPHVKDLKLSNGYIFTYVADANPLYTLGSAVARNTGYKLDRIYRPCAFDDLNCIRRVFAQNSDCKPVKGPVDDPYILDWLPIHLAHANVTFILKNAQVGGLNDWKIKEFYVNKVTDKLVLEVVFKAITVYCPAALVKYHRKGKESVELSDYSTVIYKDISLTLTVPNIKDLQLSDADVYAYIPDANPPFSVGSAMTDNSDLGHMFQPVSSDGTPCNPQNLDCIRIYFSNTWACLVQEGLLPQLANITEFEFPAPSSNMSVTAYGIEVRGVTDGRVLQIYVQPSNELMLATEWPHINIYCNRVVVHRPGKEDISVSDFEIRFDYVIIQGFFASSEITISRLTRTFVEKVYQPAFEHSPSQSAEQLNNLFGVLLQDVRLMIQRLFVVRGASFMAYLKERNLCQPHGFMGSTDGGICTSDDTRRRRDTSKTNSTTTN